jgi:hypothetical protein
MLPLVTRTVDRFVNFINDKNYPTKLFHNTYLYLKNSDENEVLNVFYKKDTDTIFDLFEQQYLMTNNFINKVDYGIFNCYQYRIPEEYLADYYSFVAGKYSKL